MVSESVLPLLSAGCPSPRSSCAFSSGFPCNHSVFSLCKFAFQCFVGLVLSGLFSVHFQPYSSVMRMSVPIASMLHCRGIPVLVGNAARRLGFACLAPV